MTNYLTEAPMNASKENCQKALDNLLTQKGLMNYYEFCAIKDFLEAALRKLPTEAAYQKDSMRKARNRKAT